MVQAVVFIDETTLFLEVFPLVYDQSNRLALLPKASNHLSVLLFQFSEPVRNVLHEVSLVDPSILIQVFPSSVFLVIGPVALVDLIVGPGELPDSLEFSIEKLSFVRRTVLEDYFPLSLILVPPELAHVDIPVALFFSLSVFRAMFEATHILAARLVDGDSFSMGQALFKHSLVKRSILVDKPAQKTWLSFKPKSIVVVPVWEETLSSASAHLRLVPLAGVNGAVLEQVGTLFLQILELLMTDWFGRVEFPVLFGEFLDFLVEFEGFGHNQVHVLGEVHEVARDGEVLGGSGGVESFLGREEFFVDFVSNHGGFLVETLLHFGPHNDHLEVTKEFHENFFENFVQILDESLGVLVDVVVNFVRNGLAHELIQLSQAFRKMVDFLVLLNQLFNSARQVHLLEVDLEIAILLLQKTFPQFGKANFLGVVVVDYLLVIRGHVFL